MITVADIFAFIGMLVTLVLVFMVVVSYIDLRYRVLNLEGQVSDLKAGRIDVGQPSS